MKMNIRKVTTAGACLALCLFLPFLTGNNRELGTLLSLMHIPALLCGFVCGWPYGLLVGLIAPLLRSVLFGMPPMPVVAVPMAFELAVYGAVSGWLYQIFPRRNQYIYVSLICAMIVGRFVNLLVAALFGQAVAVAAVQRLFLGTIGGIVIQVVIIPVMVMALKKSGFMEYGRDQKTAA